MKIGELFNYQITNKFCLHLKLRQTHDDNTITMVLKKCRGTAEEANTGSLIPQFH